MNAVVCWLWIESSLSKWQSPTSFFAPFFPTHGQNDEYTHKCPKVLRVNYFQSSVKNNMLSTLYPFHTPQIYN